MCGWGFSRIAFCDSLHVAWNIAAICLDSSLCGCALGASGVIILVHVPLCTLDGLCGIVRCSLLQTNILC